MLEKLIWISAFMLVGARHPGATVGAVEKEFRSEVIRTSLLFLRFGWKYSIRTQKSALAVILKNFFVICAISGVQPYC